MFINGEKGEKHVYHRYFGRFCLDLNRTAVSDQLGQLETNLPVVLWMMKAVGGDSEDDKSSFEKRPPAVAVAQTWYD